MTRTMKNPYLIFGFVVFIFLLSSIFLFSSFVHAQTPQCFTQISSREFNDENQCQAYIDSLPTGEYSCARYFTGFGFRWTASGRQGTFCPNLENAMSISVSPDANNLAIGDGVTVRWSGPDFASCVLSGDTPEGRVSESTNSGSKTFPSARAGNYSFNFECTGVLDNQRSDETGTARKTLAFEVARQPRYCMGPWTTIYVRDGWGGLSPGQCYNQHSILARSAVSISGYGALSDFWVPQASPQCIIGRRDRAPVLSPGQRGGSVFCPALNEVVQLSVDKTHIDPGEQFSISWSAPFALECTLTGKDPRTKETFSETFSGTRLGDYIRGNRTYGTDFFIEEGIYPFTLSCRGYLDNRNTDRVGTIERRVTVSVGDIPPPPNVVEFTIEPEEIQRGGTATLRWRVENATAVSINQRVGVVRAEGSREVSPTVTTQYSITASGRFPELGLSRKSVVLRVTAPDRPDISLPPAVIEEGPPTEFEFPEVEQQDTLDLKVNGQNGPLTMQVPASFTLSWNLDRYCVKHGSWLGITRKAGSERVTITRPGTYTYKMYCPLAGSDEVTIRAVGTDGGAPAEPLPVAEASVSVDGATFSRSVRVIRGEPVNIFLSAAVDVNNDGLASRDETDQWTGLISFGGRCEWNTDLNRGEPTFDGAVFDPQNPAECAINLGNITFFDEPGVYRIGVLRLVQNDGKVSNTAYVNIAVHDPPPPEGPPEIVFTINGVQTSDMVLGAPAQYSLGWSARNATSCVASGDWSGDRFPAGVQNFVASEKREFTYTITCTGELGVSSETIFLKVAELPVCDFTALPTVIDSRAVFVRQSELSWTCEFANTCAITPGVGPVNTFGLVRVSPSTTTNYVLTCQNLDGESSFEQRVEVR